ncbi:MAG: glycosyltransferase [Bacteroidota bacterium]
MKVVIWGTYDLLKPRVRMMLASLRQSEIELIECHADVWIGVEDKSQVTQLSRKIALLFRWILSYPRLIWRYLSLPPHDILLIGYMGHLDVLVIWPFARLRGVKIVWDVFLSLYDTVVNDRKLVSRYSPIAWGIYCWEWLATRSADILVLDTDAHGRYLEALYSLPEKCVQRVFVGVEKIYSAAEVEERRVPASGKFTILFYGQFAPLHGIETIIRAAKLVEDNYKDVQWVIVGKGQEETKIEKLINDLNLTTVSRIPLASLAFESLVGYVADADVCLGLFGTSGKASRVISTKVFQILGAKKPLITADTPAVRELLQEGPCIRLVPPGNPEKLAKAVEYFIEMKKKTGRINCDEKSFPIIGIAEVGKEWQHILRLAVLK